MVFVNSRTFIVAFETRLFRSHTIQQQDMSASQQQAGPGQQGASSGRSTVNSSAPLVPGLGEGVNASASSASHGVRSGSNEGKHPGQGRDAVAGSSEAASLAQLVASVESLREQMEQRMNVVEAKLSDVGAPAAGVNFGGLAQLQRQEPSSSSVRRRQQPLQQVLAAAVGGPSAIAGFGGGGGLGGVVGGGGLGGGGGGGSSVGGNDDDDEDDSDYDDDDVGADASGVAHARNGGSQGGSGGLWASMGSVGECDALAKITFNFYTNNGSTSLRMWLCTQQWRSGHNSHIYKESEHLCVVLDLLLRDLKFDHPAVERMMRRLMGLRAVDQGADWTVMDVLQLDEPATAAVPFQLRRNLFSTAEKMKKFKTKQRGGRGSGRGGRGSKGGGGRGGSAGGGQSSRP